MARSGLRRTAVRAALKQAAGPPHKPDRNRRNLVLMAAGWAVLLGVIGVLSAWAHHSLATARPGPPNTAAASPMGAFAPPQTSAPMTVQLRTWLTNAEPSINALVTARDNIAATAALDDIAATATACRTAVGAVANSQQHLPSPDPTLNTALQQAINSYQIGLHYCISGAQNQDGSDLGRAVNYINLGNADLQTAVDILQRNLSFAPHGSGVLTV